MNTFDPKGKPSRGHKSIRIPFENEAHYEICANDVEQYRKHIDEIWATNPELLPANLAEGYRFYGNYVSGKAKLKIRRIQTKSDKEVYQVIPSDVMPYMTGKTDEVEKALLLRFYKVPFEVLAYVFGRDEMYWYRMTLQLGRPSLVGTTVKSPENMPQNLLADEKHTRLKGEKVYAATTVGDGCILGAGISESASKEGLEMAYGEFAIEAREISSDYSPQSVNTDGWAATDAVWKQMFPTIKTILCFLHAVLKVKDRCRKYPEWAEIIVDKMWGIYEASDRKQFLMKCRKLRYWAKINPPFPICEVLLSVLSKAKRYAVAYEFKDAHRTSNAIDRLMDYQDRALYTMKYFHGTLQSARLMLRAQAMLWNFHPYSGRLKRSDPQRTSPATELNGFQYHSNWLHSLLISASMNGRRNMKTE